MAPHLLAENHFADWHLEDIHLLNKVPGRYSHDTMIWLNHRDKNRVQMPAKMFPHLKLLCLLYMGPTLDFDTKQRNSFLIKFGAFYNKSKILTILFIVKYDKITLFDEFLVLLGPIISRFFKCSNKEKNKQKQQRVRALVISLWSICIERA